MDETIKRLNDTIKRLEKRIERLETRLGLYPSVFQKEYHEEPQSDIGDS